MIMNRFFLGKGLSFALYLTFLTIKIFMNTLVGFNVNMGQHLCEKVYKWWHSLLLQNQFWTILAILFISTKCSENIPNNEPYFTNEP